ncbi:MAG: hypothetical protein RL480_1869, partial [Pseudomonadota bacterium]
MARAARAAVAGLAQAPAGQKALAISTAARAAGISAALIDRARMACAAVL